MAAPTWSTGEVLCLSNGNVTCRFLLEKRGASAFAFALPDSPYRRLRVTRHGDVIVDPSTDGGRYAAGKEATWMVVRIDEACDRFVLGHSNRGEVRLLRTRRGGRGGGPAGLVEADACASELLEAVPAAEACGRHHGDAARADVSQLAAAAGDSFVWTARVAEPDLPPRARAALRSGELGQDAMAAFAESGYAVLRDVVPAEHLNAAKAFINGRIARVVNAWGAAQGATCVGEKAVPPGPEPWPGPGPEPEPEPKGMYGYDAERRADPAGAGGKGALHSVFGSSSWQLLALARNDVVWRIVERFLGAGNADPNVGAQVALRFSGGVHDDLTASGSAVRRKLGGRDWHTDGMRQGRKHSFSILLGVALSDMAVEDVGNLCVWPGSHRFCHSAMRHPDGKIQRDRGWEAGDGALPDLGAPTQLLLRAGDIVLAHSELAHAGGPHLGPDIRYMVYFRVRHRGWGGMADAFLRDMWCDYEGLKRELAGRAGGLDTPGPSGWDLPAAAR